MPTDDILDDLLQSVDVDDHAREFARQIRENTDLDPAADPGHAVAVVYTAVTVTDDTARLDQIVDAADTTHDRATQSIEALHDDLDIALTVAVARARLPTVLAVLDAPDAVLDRACSFLHDWRLEDSLTAYSPSAVIAAAVHAGSVDAEWPVTQAEIADATDTSTVTVRSRTNDLAAAVPDAPGDVLATKISCEELLDALRDLQDDLGCTPTKQDMTVHGRYSTTPYEDRFNSWNEALDAAGLDPEHRTDPIPAADYLDELRRLADDLDRTPTVTDMDVYGEYCSTTAYNHWDSWSDALDAAGLSRDDD